MSAIAGADRRWIFGPAPDLLLGCGLGYALLIALVPLLALDVPTMAGVATIGSLVIGAPHYGATLLRVYRRADDRRQYAFFTVYLSAVVWIWFAAGLYHVGVGSALITLYFTWSPYHYTGQNYGLAVMFLRRRGVPFDAVAKKLLHASFMLSFALTFVSLHREIGGGSGVGNFADTPFAFLSLGLPAAAHGVAFGVLLGFYVGATVAAFWRLRGAERAIDLLPVLALVATQALWFSVPETWRWVTGTVLPNEGIGWLFLWAIFGHSVQYLWITTYYAVGQSGRRKRWAYLFSTLGAGAAIWTVPALVFSPQLLGTHPYSLGLFLMIAAAVNVHHFVLDGAIWKLRDTGVGAILLARSTQERKAESDASETGSGWAALGWAAAALVTAFALFGAVEETRWESAWADSKTDAARRAGARLTAIGRADPRFALMEGRAALRRGDVAGARRAFDESLALYPTAEAWFALAGLHARQNERQRSLTALERCLELDENHPAAHRLLGLALVGDGELEEGIRHLTRAAQLIPDVPQIQKELSAALDRRGRESR